MDKRVSSAFLIVGSIAFILVAFAYFQGKNDLITSTSNPVAVKTTATPSSTNAPTQKVASSEAMPTNSNYKEYKSGILAKDTDLKRVLFFYANWCPICGPLDKEIKANLNKIPEDLEIIRVNYEDSDTDSEEKALAQKYGITYQHTFVQIDDTGNEIQKWNGGDLSMILAKTR